MFTGLVETTGKIIRRDMHGESGKLIVESAKPFSGLERGESIAVNGACLTLESGMNGGPLAFHVMRETFSRTNLGSLPIGSPVNLERALCAGARLGGHIVTGHIDGIAHLLSVKRRHSDMEIEIEIPETLADGFVEKGSVAVDGISLTLESVTEDRFRIGIIPTTWENTALRYRKPGDFVNLETDLIGKYVAAYLKRRDGGGSGITMETLAGAGFL